MRTAWVALCVAAALAAPALSSVRRPHSTRKGPAVEVEALADVLSASPYHGCGLVLVDPAGPAHGVFTGQAVAQLPAAWGLTVLEARQDGRHDNATQPHLSRLVAQARRVRQTSRCVMLVVVSDDPAFLASFAHWSLKGGLLVWSTRLVLLTRLPLQRLHHLHRLLSTSNAILFLLHPTSTSARCSVYVQLPYTSEGSPPLLVASWTPRRGLVLTSAFPLFPDKFTKFIRAPNLVVVIEQPYPHKIYWTEDPKAPGGRRLSYSGFYNEVVMYFARTINFTYTYVRSEDKAYGAQQPNGSWSGMMRMLVGEEADFSPGGFILTPSRYEAADFPWPYPITLTYKILAAVGRPEVDPWSFLFPLTALVWALVLAALLLMLALVWLLSLATLKHTHTSSNTLQNLCRTAFQQDIVSRDEWQWERVVLGVWMLATLVLTKSYSGNLMSLLAVRHLPQPFHSLRDVLDHPSVIAVWQKSSATEQFIRESDDGILREVARLEDKGRLQFVPIATFSAVVDDLVRWGKHVLIDLDALITNLMKVEFSKTATCDFYLSDEGYFPILIAPAVPKDSPLGPALVSKIMALGESGLFMYWSHMSQPNSTSCQHTPEKVLVNTSLSLSNLWGMFCVLGFGFALAVLVLLVELIV